MNTLNPRNVRLMFNASLIMLVISTVISVANVATVLSAPLQTVTTVPGTVGFEGFLTTTGGAPLADGTYSVTFRVYDAATAGNTLWTETQTNVQVKNGLYSVALGSITPFGSNVFNGSRWIGVTVGAGSENTPRTQISSVPFALNADNSNKIGGGVLTNLIALFEGSCPSGWSEYTAARGRVVVGVPSGGTLSGTVGTALTNLENRTHSHGMTHTHTWNPGGSYNVAAGNPVTNGGVLGSGVISGSNSTYSGNTGIAATSDVIPYIQLRYCKLNP
jgi:hypothetical protein